MSTQVYLLANKTFIQWLTYFQGMKGNNNNTKKTRESLAWSPEFVEMVCRMTAILISFIVVAIAVVVVVVVHLYPLSSRSNCYFFVCQCLCLYWKAFVRIFLFSFFFLRPGQARILFTSSSCAGSHHYISMVRLPVLFVQRQKK